MLDALGWVGTRSRFPAVLLTSLKDIAQAARLASLTPLRVCRGGG
jgi:hypothetical protein